MCFGLFINKLLNLVTKMGIFEKIAEFKKSREEKLTEIKKEREKRAINEFQIKETVSGDFSELIRKLVDSSLIMLITGRRGSGKTALGMKLVEVVNILGKQNYVIGFESARLPRWIKKANSIEDVKNDSVLMIDEAALTFSARESMKKTNKELGKLMAIARHKNLSLIIITQSSAMLDLNVLRLADILLFKEPSLLQARFERKALQDMFENVQKKFDSIKGEKNKHAYIISDYFEGFLSCNLPQFWNDGISKSYAKVRIE